MPAFWPILQPNILIIMPILHNPPRQEPTAVTTGTPNLVVVGHPLNQKHITTIFQLSFDPSIPELLQYSQKTSNSCHLNHSNPGIQFPTLRVYVLKSWCKSGWYQFPSLSRWQPQKSGYFCLLPSAVLIFFNTFWLTSKTTTPRPVILTIVGGLN